jgi:hypothetical protein
VSLAAHASGKADEAGTEHDSQAATGASSDEGHRLMTAAERASSRADALVAMAEV